MGFIQKILKFLTNKHERDGMITFIHEMEDDDTERVITVHADGEGFIVMTIFTPEEWQMVVDIITVTGGDIESVVKEIAEDNNVATIILDPKDFN